jgi:nucleotide-binding universal stress UspA family protein
VAVDLASTQAAELVLLHVAMPLPAATADSAGRDAGLGVDDAQRKVDERLGRVRSRRITAEGLVERGEPVSVIVRTATRMRAGLIVVGSHRFVDPATIVVGKVAERLVRTAPCPVLVMKGSTATQGGLTTAGDSRARAIVTPAVSATGITPRHAVPVRRAVGGIRQPFGVHALQQRVR